MFPGNKQLVSRVQLTVYQPSAKRLFSFLKSFFFQILTVILPSRKFKKSLWFLKMTKRTWAKRNKITSTRVNGHVDSERHVC